MMRSTTTTPIRKKANEESTQAGGQWQEARGPDLVEPEALERCVADQHVHPLLDLHRHVLRGGGGSCAPRTAGTPPPASQGYHGERKIVEDSGR
jgi:hypothetical protein